MKKIIATVSTCMVLGFAVALANADDSSTESSMHEETSTTTQQSGTAGSDSMSKESMPKDSSVSSAGTASSDHWKTAKTCTDSSGVTYERGKKGFSTCVDQMKKSENRDQMSGTAGKDASDVGYDASNAHIKRRANTDYGPGDDASNPEESTN